MTKREPTVAMAALRRYRHVEQLCDEIRKNAATLLPVDDIENEKDVDVPWTAIAELARIEAELTHTATHLLRDLPPEDCPF